MGTALPAAATTSHTLSCSGDTIRDTPGDTSGSCPLAVPSWSREFSFSGRDAGRDAGAPVQSSAETQHSPGGQKTSGHQVVPRCHLRLSQHLLPPRSAHGAPAFSILTLFSHLQLISVEKSFQIWNISLFYPLRCPHKKVLPLARGLFAVYLPGQSAAAIKGFSWEIYLQQNLIFNRKSFHLRLLNTFPNADP